MKRIPLLAVLFTIAFALLTACSAGAPAAITLADVPAYPDATLLQPGENPIADTLAQNVQTAGSMGQKLDQQIFSLGSADWNAVSSFYNEKLSAEGWKKLDMPVPANDMMQMEVFTRGTQSLTVAQMTDPMGGGAFLLFSLASQ